MQVHVEVLRYLNLKFEQVLILMSNGFLQILFARFLCITKHIRSCQTINLPSANFLTRYLCIYNYLHTLYIRTQVRGAFLNQVLPIHLNFKSCWIKHFHPILIKIKINADFVDKWALRIIINGIIRTLTVINHHTQLAKINKYKTGLMCEI